ncbi:resuscitation-promoting factor RpfC [Mycobacterium saskatchewanense]|uniref:Resuscitation-promoting factor RpfC n=1 Tax=Mycobacterium saskatchewanense TaxID=220927 RepID=A0AAJ3NME4_9MYCO|nr:Resuscitation-promoting factor RpfC [Mycobacterium saskatchewanense]BBX61598.1 resuscitation-promoting factor RpfC [Mycobacterium saskatchewanense]
MNTVAEIPGMRKLCKSFVKSAVIGGFVAASLTSSAIEATAAPTPNWDAIAQCESGGNWHANTGNGEYGGLQFKPGTWSQYGGVGNPATASREQQIAVANRVFADQGIEAWPKCGANSGLPIAWYSHPAQGIKQIINGLIQAAVPH